MLPLAPCGYAQITTTRIHSIHIVVIKDLSINVTFHHFRMDSSHAYMEEIVNVMDEQRAKGGHLKNSHKCQISHLILTHTIPILNARDTLVFCGTLRPWSEYIPLNKATLTLVYKEQIIQHFILVSYQVGELLIYLV